MHQKHLAAGLCRTTSDDTDQLYRRSAIPKVRVTVTIRLRVRVSRSRVSRVRFRASRVRVIVWFMVMVSGPLE